MKVLGMNRTWARYIRIRSCCRWTSLPCVALLLLVQFSPPPAPPPPTRYFNGAVLLLFENQGLKKLGFFRTVNYKEAALAI